MKAWRVASTMIAAGVSCVLLCGCSGVGVPPEEVRGGSIQAAAGDHLSAALLVRSWLNVLYGSGGASAAASRREPVGSTSFDFEVLPDGTLHAWGALEDGSVFDQWSYPSGAGSWRQDWPDHTSMTSEWDAPTVTDISYAVSVREKRRDGTRLDYAYCMTFGLDGDTHRWDGEAILSDLRRMHYSVLRSSDEDQVVVALADGSDLNMRVPIGYVQTVGLELDYAEGLAGAFRAADGATQTFRVTGERGTWTQWEFAGSGGVDGRFVLGENLAGSGQLLQGGTVVGAFRWQAEAGRVPPTFMGVLDLFSVAAPAVAPSAAARDFQIDRWVSSISELGPHP